MNYLAHAYLSFGYPEILVGNMVSDFVKGKKKFNYTQTIQQGIMLHRSIDIFTDAHEATHQARIVLKPAVGLYSGAFVDIVYDHFLALDAKELSAVEWMHFSQKTYQSLQLFQPVFPDRFAKMFPYMIAQNWLYNYRYLWGIENSFRGLAHRAAYLQSSAEVFDLFKKNYQTLQNCYDYFFADVKNFAFNQLQIVLNT